MPLNRPCVLTKSEAEVAVALNNELLDIAIEVAFSDNRVVNYQREALVAASKHRPTSLPCLHIPRHILSNYSRTIPIHDNANTSADGRGACQ